MDRETRNRIQRATQDVRTLLEREYAEQLEGTFDIRLDGMIAMRPGSHLDAEQRVLRTKLVAAVEHLRSGGLKDADAVAAYLREAAFTTLNRLVALKMLEARNLVQECISRGGQSSGFKEFAGLAPGLVQLPDHGYQLYIESLFDEIGREVRVLFDRRDPASLLWPRRQALVDLLAILNSPDLAELWKEDETIGWVYQYFNSDEERRQMRAESQAPRNSRELAVRNQFFTPRYVVEFLVDNTLGRIWYEMRHGKTILVDKCRYLVRRPNDFFLNEGEKAPEEDPVADANLSQEELLKRTVYVPFRAKKDPRDIKILDPACGSGHFLLYTFDLLAHIYEEGCEDDPSPVSEVTGQRLGDDYASPVDLRKAIPGLILRHNLHGVDIDPRAAQIAALALWMRAQRALHEFAIARGDRPAISKTNIVVAEPMPGEREMRQEFIASLDTQLGKLVGHMFEKMELAGEAGSLLRIEDEITTAVRDLYGETGSLFKKSDEERWHSAEAALLSALSSYAEHTQNGRAFRRRLFAEEAAHGFAFIDLCRQRYDVVLMNPPFGFAASSSKKYIQNAYPDDWTDLYSAFIVRGLDLLTWRGALGAITSNLWLTIKRQENLRNTVRSAKNLRLVADLGPSVLDDATVNTALAVIDNEHAGSACTVGFWKALTEESREQDLSGGRGRWMRLSAFRDIPSAPFCFDLGSARLALWSTHSGRLDPHLVLAFVGNFTFDNFRFLRTHWEVADEVTADDWIRYDKGGAFQPFFKPSVLVWRYKKAAAENRAFGISKHGTDAQVIQSIKHWRKPGLCYSEATSVGFSPRILMADHVVSGKSIALLPRDPDLSLAILALMVSTHVQDLLYAFGYHRNIEKGAVSNLPLDEQALSTELDELGRRCVEAVWRLEATVETSPVFLRPARGNERADDIRIVIDLMHRIDEVVAQTLYGKDIAPLSTPKPELLRAALGARFGTEVANVEQWTSYAVGAVFGRWNPSCAGVSLHAQLPMDFRQALPRRQPGSVDSQADASARNGILCVDEGHEGDLPTHVDRCLAALDVQGVEDARQWLSTQFFNRHLAWYSESGRSAPIYWQLSTSSASYSIWLYYHRFTKDTFYQVLNDYVTPKLQHEERKLRNLVQTAGPNPTTSQRKEVAEQEAFVEELRAFREEVARIAPLWNPDLNDGVIINFAPLWRLVPQHRAWQKECKDCWDKLVAGDHDWAHLAMHLWPERVVPNCAEDRSLAIAHELEDVFWAEDANGKWQPRKVDQATINQLIKERTSPAVKDALKSLLEAPAPLPGRGGRKKAQGRVTSRRSRDRASGISAHAEASGADAAIIQKVKAVIASARDGGTKADVLAATGLTDSQWNAAINALLTQGAVTKTGERGGTRYRLTESRRQS